MSDEEKRVAPDGGWYTKDEFVDFYGGTAEWDEAAPIEGEFHNDGDHPEPSSPAAAARPSAVPLKNRQKVKVVSEPATKATKAKAKAGPRGREGWLAHYKSTLYATDILEETLGPNWMLHAA